MRLDSQGMWYNIRGQVSRQVTPEQLDARYIFIEITFINIEAFAAKWIKNDWLGVWPRKSFPSP